MMSEDPSFATNAFGRLADALVKALDLVPRGLLGFFAFLFLILAIVLLFLRDRIDPELALGMFFVAALVLAIVASVYEITKMMLRANQRTLENTKNGLREEVMERQEREQRQR